MARRARPREVGRLSFAIDDPVLEAQHFEFLQRSVVAEERFPFAVEDREQVFRGAAITLPDTIPLNLDQLDHS